MSIEAGSELLTCVLVKWIVNSFNKISFYDVAVKTDGSNGSTIKPTLP